MAILAATLGPVADATPSATLPPDGPVVVMAPVHVTPWNGWGLLFKYDLKKTIREIIFHVEPGSLAAKAGLQTGDRLVAYGGKTVIGMTTAEYMALERSVTAHKKGEAVTLPYTIMRDGVRRDFTVIRPAVVQAAEPSQPIPAARNGSP
jgi:predicted metalloprotease with PDZ domain